MIENVKWSAFYHFHGVIGDWKSWSAPLFAGMPCNTNMKCVTGRQGFFFLHLCTLIAVVLWEKYYQCFPYIDLFVTACHIIKTDHHKLILQKSLTSLNKHKHCMCNGCMPVRPVCKPHSPDLKRGALATDARGCSLWRSLLERPPPAPESRVRDPAPTSCGSVDPGGLHWCRDPDGSEV